MRLPPAGRLLLLALALLLLVLPQSPAAAQGTLNLVPDPIALADLRLGISLRHAEPLAGGDAEARWAEVVDAHDRYLAAMRALRDGSIEAALQARWAAEAGGLWANPTALRADLRRRQAVDAEIARLDVALISDIVEALGESVRPAIEAFAARRASERELPRLGVSHRAAIVDMRSADRILESRFPDGEARSRILASARAFDREQAALIRRLVEASIARDIRLTERAAAEPVDWSDPAAAQATLQARLAAERAAHPETEEASSRLLARKRALVEAAVRELPFDDARELRNRLRRADPWLNWQVDGAERHFRAALRNERLDERGRAVVREQYEAWARAEERLFAELEQAVSASGGGTSAHFEALQSHRSALRELESTTIARLRDSVELVLTEEEQERLFLSDPFEPMEAAGQPQSELELATAASSAGSYRGDRYRMGATIRPPDPALPLSWMEGATADERAVVETIVTDALAEWMADLAQRVDRIGRTLIGAREAFLQPTHNPEAFELALAAAMTDLEAADAHAVRMGAALAAALPPERADALACATLERRLEIWVDDDQLLTFRTDWEWELLGNPPRAARIAAQASSTPSLQAALLAEGEELIAAARARRAAEIEAGSAAVRIGEPMLQRRADETPDDARAREARAAELRAAERALIEAIRGSGNRFRAALGRMSAGLDDETTIRLRVLYERDAYPTLVFDSRKAEPFAVQALALPSLDAERRQALTTLLDEHARVRDRQLLAFIDGMRAKPARDSAYPVQVANARLMRRFFERNELHTRLVFALRRLLTEEEAGSIRALDRYELLTSRLTGRWHDD